MRDSGQRGWTLVEGLVVMAIAALALGTVVPGFADLLERRRIEGVAAEMSADLQFVRTEAVSRNRGLRIGFEHDAAGSTCYVIHTGPSGACRCLTGAPAVCDAGAEAIKTLSFPAGARPGVWANVPSIRIDPVRGTVSPTATLRIRSAERPGLHHVVNLLGRVRTCTPPGGLPGYPAC